MTQEPYRSARRVFWVMDNGSAHRGAKGDARLRDRWPTLAPVHTPRHASWLNQIEIYFSILQRKVLTPTDFASLANQEHVGVFCLDPVDLIAGDLPRTQRRLVEAWAELHHDELKTDWERLQAGRPALPIAPLQ